MKRCNHTCYICVERKRRSALQAHNQRLLRTVRDLRASLRVISQFGLAESAYLRRVWLAKRALAEAGVNPEEAAKMRDQDLLRYRNFGMAALGAFREYVRREGLQQTIQEANL